MGLFYNPRKHRKTVKHCLFTCYFLFIRDVINLRMAGILLKVNIFTKVPGLNIHKLIFPLQFSSSFKL